MYDPDNLKHTWHRFFGSNLMGHHTGGAAKIAYERFGVVCGFIHILCKGTS